MIDKSKRPTINQLRAFTIPPWFTRFVRLAPQAQPWPSVTGQSPALAELTRAESGGSGSDAPAGLELEPLPRAPRNGRWFLWLGIGAVATTLGLLVVPAFWSERTASPRLAPSVPAPKQEPVTSSATSTLPPVTSSATSTVPSGLASERVLQPRLTSATTPTHDSHPAHPSSAVPSSASSARARVTRPQQGSAVAPSRTVEAPQRATDVGPSF